MADFVSIKLEGAEELERQLKGLDETLRKKAYRKALTKGANVVLKSAKEKVPVDTGNLKRSLAKKVTVSKREHSARIGWTQGKQAKHDAYYGHMVEYGTMRSAAQPFMRPSLDNHEDDVLDAYGEAIQDVLDKL